MFTIVFDILKRFLPSNFNVLRLLSSIGSQWKVVLIVVLAGFVYYQNAWTGPRFLFGLNTFHAKNEQIETLVGKLTEEHNRNASLVQAIEKANKTVDEWKSITNKLEHEQTQVKKDIENIQKNTSERVNKTLSDKTPTTCEEAIDYLRNAIPEIVGGVK